MRRKFVWDPDLKELVEVSVDYQPTPRNTDGALWNDRHYDNMKATDGTDISSRAKHREYMKRNGLTTADDFKGEWSKAEQQREAYFKHGKGGAVSRDDVGRAIHQLEQQQRKRSR